MHDLTPDMQKRCEKMAKLRKKYVCYIIDSAPIYIVFYTTRSEINDYKRISHEYVFYDKGTNEYKLTNLYFMGYFQQFIEDTDSIKKYIFESIKQGENNGQ